MDNLESFGNLTVAPSSSEVTEKPTENKTTLLLSKLNLPTQEVKIYKKCMKYLKNICAFRNRIKYTTRKSHLNRVFKDEYVKKLIKLKVSNRLLILLQSSLRNCRRQKKLSNYSFQQKVKALTLYKKSPGCYRLLRRLFSLPCQKMLNNFLNKLQLHEGINTNIFKVLRKTRGVLAAKNSCILSYNTMCVCDDDVISDLGYEDHNYTNRKISKALVFMLTGVKEKWQLPLAYYYLDSVTAERLSDIIKEVLRECFKVRLNVLATICHPTNINVEVLDLLGSTVEKPYFKIDGHEVVTLFDPLQLVMCLRNGLMLYDVEASITVKEEVDGKHRRGVSKWSHITQFYESDKNDTQFNFAIELSEENVNPNRKQKRRFYIAAQLCDPKITMGLMCRSRRGEIPADAEATASILNNIYPLICALTTYKLDLDYKYSKDLTTKSPHLKLFQTIKTYITELKFLNCDSPPLCQKEWIRTLNGINKLWINSIQLRVARISTVHLNVERLRKHLKLIRYYSGTNVPNLNQFVTSYKMALIDQFKYDALDRKGYINNPFLKHNLKTLICKNNEQSSLTSAILMYAHNKLFK